MVPSTWAQRLWGGIRGRRDVVSGLERAVRERGANYLVIAYRLLSGTRRL